MAEIASGAISSKGVMFYRWQTDSSPASWQQISEIKGAGGPNKTKDTHEVTHFNSPDGYKEFIGGFKDGGSVPLTMSFNRTYFDYLNADFEGSTNGNYKIVLPDSVSTTIEFEGLVTELQTNAQVGDAVMADCTIKVSGKPEVYDGSSGSPVT